MTDTDKTSGKNPSGQTAKTGGARSVARLGAVQAMYQMQMSEGKPASVIREFLEHRLEHETEDGVMGRADKKFFQDLVNGATENRDVIDEKISANLSEKWKFERIDNIAKSILRVAIYELMSRPDVPTKVIINEYLDVAHAFFDQSEPSFINGILDRLARQIRA